MNDMLIKGPLAKLLGVIAGEQAMVPPGPVPPVLAEKVMRAAGLALQAGYPVGFETGPYVTGTVQVWIDLPQVGAVGWLVMTAGWHRGPIPRRATADRIAGYIDAVNREGDQRELPVASARRRLAVSPSPRGECPVCYLHFAGRPVGDGQVRLNVHAVRGLRPREECAGSGSVVEVISW